MPVLPAGARPLRVLHLSDIHMTPSQSRKQEWVRSLADLEPDLVVNTGDNLAHLDALPVVLDALGPLLDVPGVFVLGSNDYYAPTARNPLCVPAARRRPPQHPHRQAAVAGPQGRLLRRGLARPDQPAHDVHGRRPDRRLGRRRRPPPGVRRPGRGQPAPADSSADLRLGVAHAPYLRVLDQFAGDGYDAIFAGHTHGGQVCLPFKGALVTNCDLEPARAKGLHRHPADSRPGEPGTSWLHVSAGLGTSPYTPFRVACRPEATLLTLTPLGLISGRETGIRSVPTHPVCSPVLVARLRRDRQSGCGAVW